MACRRVVALGNRTTDRPLFRCGVSVKTKGVKKRGTLPRFSHREEDSSSRISLASPRRVGAPKRYVRHKRASKSRLGVDLAAALPVALSVSGLPSLVSLRPLFLSFFLSFFMHPFLSSLLLFYPPSLQVPFPGVFPPTTTPSHPLSSPAPSLPPNESHAPMTTNKLSCDQRRQIFRSSHRRPAVDVLLPFISTYLRPTALPPLLPPPPSHPPYLPSPLPPKFLLPSLPPSPVSISYLLWVVGVNPSEELLHAVVYLAA